MGKYLSYDDALAKMQSYCAYQERCHKEVRQKLRDLGIYGDDVDNIITDLIEEKFLNEQRFAIAFAGGKFRIKKWGRFKIRRALKEKQVSDYCIRKAMASEIPEEDYRETLIALLEKRDRLSPEPNPFKRKQKLAKYALSRGYESWFAWEIVNSHFSPEEKKRKRK